MRAVIVLASTLALLARAGVAEDLMIEHAAVSCLIAEEFPRLVARVEPGSQVARARVYFRAEGNHWYFVEMGADSSGYYAVLPRPSKSATRVHYYIEATGRTFSASRTPEHTAGVIQHGASCGVAGPIAPVVPAARIVLGAGAGAPPVPLGFSAAGIVAAGSAAGATAAAGLAQGGGGVPTVLVVAGAVGAAAAAGVVIAGRLESGLTTIEGNVYKGVCACFARGPGAFPLGDPIAGAVVGTSLDSRTAVTDASGRFTLVTDTSDEVTVEGRPYAINIAAGGCQTFSVTHPWGRIPSETVFTLACP